RVELLAELINQELPEKKKVEPRGFAKNIRGVGFKTKEIKARESAYRDKSAVVYDRDTFARVFNSFSLPTPEDFNPPIPPKPNNPNQKNEVKGGGLDSDQPFSQTQPPRRIALREQDLDDVGGLGGLDSQKCSEEEISVSDEGQTDAVPTVVALDTETE